MAWSDKSKIGFKAVMTRFNKTAAIFATIIVLGISQATPAAADEPVIDFTAIGQFIAHTALELGQWATENAHSVLKEEIMSGGANQVSNAVQLNGEQNQIVMQGTGQAIVDANTLNARDALTAQFAADANVPRYSQAAEIAQAYQARNMALNSVQGMLRSMSYVILNKGTGVNADETKPAAKAEDVCGLIGTNWSFIDPVTFGDTPNGINCKGASAKSSNVHYANAHTMISSVIKPLQYLLPDTANVTITTDNHILFNNVSASADGAYYDDPVRFVAAWKFCEGLKTPHTPLASSGGRPVQERDIAAIADYQNAVGRSLDAYNECLDNIALRTACPTTGTVKAGSYDCHRLQLNMCHALFTPTSTDSTSNTGLGIDTINDPEADNALKNCDTDGLSVAMFDKIMANRCANYNHVGMLGSSTGGNAAAVNMSQEHCQDQITNYDNLQAAYKQSFVMFVNEARRANAQTTQQ